MRDARAAGSRGSTDDLLRVLRDAEHGLISMCPMTPVRLRAKSESESDAGRRADQPGDRALPEKERADLSAGGAKRAQDADLRRAAA